MFDDMCLLELTVTTNYEKELTELKKEVEEMSMKTKEQAEQLERYENVELERERILDVGEKNG